MATPIGSGSLSKSETTAVKERKSVPWIYCVLDGIAKVGVVAAMIKGVKDATQKNTVGVASDLSWLIASGGTIWLIRENTAMMTVQEDVKQLEKANGQFRDDLEAMQNVGTRLDVSEKALGALKLQYGQLEQKSTQAEQIFSSQLSAASAKESAALASLQESEGKYKRDVSAFESLVATLKQAAETRKTEEGQFESSMSALQEQNRLLGDQLQSFQEKDQRLEALTRQQQEEVSRLQQLLEGQRKLSEKTGQAFIAAEQLQSALTKEADAEGRVARLLVQLDKTVSSRSSSRTTSPHSANPQGSQ